jgi:Zn-dependent protease
LFDYFFSWIDDPINTLIFFLLAFPGRIIALSVHEFAHAWMANRCGDPTAKFMGRMTLNPLKHLDFLGTIMMIFLGYGWAKPVPVNPRNFRNYRRDDLKVSLAGVTMNFIMFIVGSILMYAALAFALSSVPLISLMSNTDRTVFQSIYDGARCVFIQDGSGYSYLAVSDILAQAPYAGSWLIENTFGSIAGYAYQMLSYFVLTNLILGIFNLLPVPPLDGYHVFNDLLLRRSELFVSERVSRAASGIMMLLVFSGVLGKGLGWLNDRILSGVGSLAEAVFRAAGIM